MFLSTYRKRFGNTFRFLLYSHLNMTNTYQFSSTSSAAKFNVGCKLLSTQLYLWFVQYCPPSFLSLSIREFVNKLVFKNVMVKNNIVPFFKYNPCLQLVLIVLWAMFPCPLQVECLLVEGVLDKRNLVYCASTRCLQIFHVCSYVDIPAHFTFSDAYCFFFQVSLLCSI